MDPKHVDDDLLNPLSRRVIGCGLNVQNALGVGYQEKVYENALAIEMARCGIGFAQQRGLTVLYGGFVVGEFVVDFLIEDMLLLELKAVKALDETHIAQCINYLKAANRRLCLLLNFGRPRMEIKRVVNGL